MAKALVTGASGFIGGKLAEMLVARGDEVTCLVRRDSRVDRLRSLGVQFLTGDVTSLESLTAAVADVDVVYHLAGLTRARNTAEFLSVNEAGVANLLDACRRRSTPPVVLLVSSLAAAGPSSRDRPRTETDPAAPVSNYGRSKRAGELAAVARAADLPITIVRPPIVLGDGDRTGLTMFQMISTFRLHLVPGLARSRFSVVHVADLAAAIIAAAQHGTRLPSPRSDHEFADRSLVDPRGHYFIAGEESPTYAELGRLIAQALDRRLLVIRFPSPMVWIITGTTELISRARRRAPYVGLDKTREALAGDWLCSPARAAAGLGFAPAASLAERLRQTVDWSRREGWL